MKARVKTPAVLARIMEYGDTSLILKVFSRDYGYISLIAKGIRKKQDSSLLSPLNEYEFTMYEPQEQGLFLLSEFSLLAECGLAANPQLWAAAQCALELLSQLLIASDENPAYYQLLTRYLEFLDRSKIDPAMLWWRFLLRVMKLMGTPLDTKTCSLCQASTQPVSAWRKGSAELVCVQCLDPLQKSDALELLSPQSSLLLNKLDQLYETETIKPTRHSLHQLNQLFAAYYQSHYNKTLKLKSLGVLEQFYGPEPDQNGSN